MSKVKKLFAIILSMVMILGMSVTTFAAAPSDHDTATITVTDVEKGAKVTAYQIVKPNYNSYGLTGYEVVKPYSIADTTNFIPTPDEIVTIAGQVSGSGIPMSATGDGTSYTAEVGAGEYIVIISGQDIYNPIVVSAAYTNSSDNSSLGNGSVSADSDWTLEGQTVFAKSTETVIEKDVSDSDVNAGDTVLYTIRGEIPSYSNTYENPFYSITDTLTNATYATSGEPAQKVDPEVTIGGSPAVKDTDYTLTWNGDTGFTFEVLNIEKYAGLPDTQREVVITYNAVISETAISTDPATNTATVHYGERNDEKTGADTTYTYTFEIDKRFTKVDENKQPLEGATFTLFEADGTTVVKTCVTEIGEDGKAYIHFEGLDAGTYILKETNAPGDYSINNTQYKIVISAEYNEDGTLKDGQPVITIDGDPDKTVEVQNTKLANLPSTGGIGTTIFTIGGCVIMIAAAGLYFASRRRQENK